jgi:deoxycytidylate deaminase
VGAVVVNRQNDIIGSGANDVPAAGGGPYWPHADDYWPEIDANGGPDYVRGLDSNERERNTMLAKAIRALVPASASQSDAELIAACKAKLADSGILDLTEFGRAVHAEVAALLSCARSCATPVGATLYCTTFPCHNCTKHIVEAGVDRVVYVEPYPKSKARSLHGDAIVLPDEEISAPHDDDRRVRYEAFTGIGPRRFVDLFSMTIGDGRSVQRKAKDRGGARVAWRAGDHSAPRVPLDPSSYLDREAAAVQVFQKAEAKRGRVRRRRRGGRR